MRAFGQTLLSRILSGVVFISFLTAWPVTSQAVDSAQVKALFANPPREYSSGPLWVWNDMLTEQQIVETMNDLADQHVKQVFVHPRPGLMTPYLSDDWFRLWKVALREAQRLDMNVWIYDENSYPSGFAGGIVPEQMPDARGKGIGFREQSGPPKWSDDILAVYRIKSDGFETVTDQIREGRDLPDGQYWVAQIRLAPRAPWFGNRFYVDLLKPGVTEKFIEVTLERYRQEVGDQFGKRIPGVFTDEPHLQPAGGLPWTDGLPQVFKKRWGYSLIDHLPSLQRSVGDWRKVRHNYVQVLLEQYIEHWSKPIHKFCEANNLDFTGHYWEHEWPTCLRAPDNMAMYAWHQRPAIDTLMNQFRQDTHAQFGNARAVKELSSVANQLGLRRTLCEAYGAGGWDLRFEDMKRIGDWLYVLGVNTLDQHLSYITIRGARKRDHPQSFSYHEPWWNAYHVCADYFSRLSVALSEGQQVNPILLIEPTTTAWMYQAEPATKARLDEIGNTFQDLINQLEHAQTEYDLGCEDIFARHGSVSGDSFIVGQRTYKTVFLPPHTENLNSKTVDLMEQFLNGGGTVYCGGEAPTRIDGAVSGRCETLSRHANWKTVQPADLVQTMGKKSREAFAIRRAKDDAGILFHHRRQLDDGELLFLVNTSIEAGSSGSIKSPARSVQQWNPHTGRTEPYPFQAVDDGIGAKFDLPPSGSLLLFLSKRQQAPPPAIAGPVKTIPPNGPPKMERQGPNVLVLDYVDITAGSETQKNMYFYKAQQFAFQKNGVDRNPWDSAVQFGSELISRTFPADSGFVATYRFQIEGPPPADLSVVIERADLYEITCNGKTISPQTGVWWLDKAFNRIDIASVARSGENEIILKASPFTIYHELESAYILGDFALKAVDQGFVIAAKQPLNLGAWNKQGLPLYGGGVKYTESFQLATPTGQYVVRVPKWYGSVAEVIVNGKSAGYVAFPPWECEVTDQLVAGVNTVELVVIGTLKNTLGPHHGGPGLGSAWPGMFHKAPATGPPPGSDYATVGYGLFEPFVLRQTLP